MASKNENGPGGWTPPEAEGTRQNSQLANPIPAQDAVQAHNVDAPPMPDTAAAIDFLKRFRPEGPWVLAAIKLERQGFEGDTFRPGEEGRLAKWINDRQRKDNIYFTVNSLLTDMKGKGAKAKKTDIKSMDWLHVDVDPRVAEPGTDMAEYNRKERKRILAALRAYNPPPTVIIDSGGGYQAFWKLSEPVPVNGNLVKAEELEGYNLHIEIMMGGDSCHNLDRIMRLPGTLNVPDERKRKKGRKLALASVVVPE